MALTIQNESKENIKISFNKGKPIEIPSLGQYVYSDSILENSLHIALMNQTKSYTHNKQYYLSINLEARCRITGEHARMVIDQKNHLFQNAIYYKYFTIHCEDSKIDDLSNIVINADEILSAYTQRKKTKGSEIAFQLLMNFFDTLSMGGIVSVILWLCYNYKVALLFLLAMYLFVSIVQLLNRRIQKSKFRFLNWAKNDFFDDDLVYFLKHINVFCKNRL